MRAAIFSVPVTASPDQTAISIDSLSDLHFQLGIDFDILSLHLLVNGIDCQTVHFLDYGIQFEQHMEAET